jgi:predicted GH43/DUF377 family glycosyl hydrolase
MTPIAMRRQMTFRPDSARVIIRPFIPADQRLIASIIGRALALSEAEAVHQLEIVRMEFASRHFDIEALLAAHFEKVRYHVTGGSLLSPARQLLVGALFSGEYALESAALFNPSIVPHPDQSGLADGALRFIMSLRATGEGHISSIEFRGGVIGADGSVTAEPVSRFVTVPEVILNPTCNYELHFDPKLAISERIIFPVAAEESNGIEDARFVRFQDDNGSVMYYATYTAYNGRRILSQFIETPDFLNFRMMTLRGIAVQNKGMALFPRRIGGRFAMLSRQDDENLNIMFSDDVHSWNELQVLRKPAEPWEMVKIGNCGSPIETDAGWLVITHGVGPMRKYCLGALLLDLDDPTRVIGSLREPLLKPESSEREGYVPNVVYSCGSLRHGDILVLSYAMSDVASVIATLNMANLLDTLQGRKI